MKGTLSPTVFHDIWHRVKQIQRIIFRTHALRSTQPIVKPIFIIGAGRSGTTLLRAMLNVHPQLSIPPEIYNLAAIIHRYYRYRFMPWHELVQVVIASFESDPYFRSWEVDTLKLYERAMNAGDGQQNLAQLIDLIYFAYRDLYYPDAIRWGCQDPLSTRNVHLLNWVFPDAQYIHLVRDGRDVVASYLHWGIYDDPVTAAHLWLDSVQTAENFGNKIGHQRYLCIRYEDLVSDKQRILGLVCNFLGIPFFETMLDHKSHVIKLNIHASHHMVSEEVTSARVGSYTEVLSAKQIELLHRLLTPRLAALGYQI